MIWKVFIGEFDLFKKYLCGGLEAYNGIWQQVPGIRTQNNYFWESVVRHIQLNTPRGAWFGQKIYFLYVNIREVQEDSVWLVQISFVLL